MQINCHIVVHAKENKVEKLEDLFSGNSYKVYVTVAPEQGKANKKMIELLAEYFGVAKSQIRILKGEISRNKIVEIIGK